MAHVMHLKKSGSGMASKTACGRNILRTPMSLNWAGFKGTKAEQRCELCAASKFAAVNRKFDARKFAEDLAKAEWEPEDEAVAEANEQKILARIRGQ